MKTDALITDPHAWPMMDPTPAMALACPRSVRCRTRFVWSGSLHLPWALMLEDEMEPGAHTVQVRLVNGALRVFQFLLN